MLRLALIFPALIRGVQAYHDMANADVEAGIGGIDMSIAFELDRPEVRVPVSSTLSAKALIGFNRILVGD
jgi:hypothetical protein